MPPVAYSAPNEVLTLWYNIDLLEEICSKQGLNVADFTPPASADSAWDWDTFVKIAQTLTVDINLWDLSGDLYLVQSLDSLPASL